MSDDNNIKKYSAADIERYHKGLMSSKERHDLEKAALEDTFLAEALEGYAFAGTNLAGDLAAIRARLDERTSERKVVPIAPRRNYSFVRVAAVIILLAGAGWLVYQFSTNNKNNKIAETAPKQEQHTGDTTVQNMAPPAGSTSTTTDQFEESHKDSHAVVT